MYTLTMCAYAYSFHIRIYVGFVYLEKFIRLISLMCTHEGFVNRTRVDSCLYLFDAYVEAWYSPGIFVPAAR